MHETDIVPQGDLSAAGRAYGLETVFRCVLHTLVFQIDVGPARVGALHFSNVVEWDELLFRTHGGGHYVLGGCCVGWAGLDGGGVFGIGQGRRDCENRQQNVRAFLVICSDISRFVASEHVLPNQYTSASEHCQS